jgi:hypothetical protein
MTEENGAFEGWVILEILGHRRLGGYLREQQIAGVGFLRIDCPSEPPVTQLYAPSSVYAITPTTEEIATAFAKRNRPAPVSQWELRTTEPARMIEAGWADDDEERDW